MTKKLLPYGSAANARLAAKVASGGGGKALMPYGSAENARLVAKVAAGGGGKAPDKG